MRRETRDRDTLYFAYGSNLDSDQMGERCPGSQVLFRARLLEHRLDFTHYSHRWSGGAADVIPDREALVWGVVYALAHGGLDQLDRFESGYDRVSLHVRDDAEQAHRVTTYRVREPATFEPSHEYLDKMLRWARHWNFPEEYVAMLRTRGPSRRG